MTCVDTTQQEMDAEDMREVDWQIIDVLHEGRANAPLLAEQTGYSAQYIRERLGRLKQDDIVEALGHGLYELSESELPARHVEEQP